MKKHQYLFFARSNYNRMLLGDVQIPDHLYIGESCRKSHGIDGKTIRYRKGNRCVTCQKINHTNQHTRSMKRKGKKRDLTAIDKFENSEMEKEISGKDLW